MDNALPEVQKKMRRMKPDFDDWFGIELFSIIEISFHILECTHEE